MVLEVHRLREAFIRKNRKYIGLLPIWGYPPPPLGGLVISGFFLGYFLSFLKLENDNLRTMKRILYDTANQATVNRAVHFKGRREKGLNVWTFGSVSNTMKYTARQSSKIWFYLQKYCTNNGILCKHAENMLSGGGGDKIVSWGLVPQSKHTLILDSPGQIHW